ncbi:MAG: hypothetical protein HYT87_00525 [Nitrospirae bacterium]|nr:hypothetical protein [Nitrospirota bacterium]
MFVKGLLLGAGITVGIIATVALAVTVGTVKTWTTGEALVADDLNTSLGNLKKAIEGLPNWTKSSANAIYTEGNVGIGTASPANKLTIEGGALQLHRSATAPFPCDASQAGTMYFDTDVPAISGLPFQSIYGCYFGPTTVPSEGNTWKWGGLILGGASD